MLRIPGTPAASVSAGKKIIRTTTAAIQMTKGKTAADRASTLTAEMLEVMNRMIPAGGVTRPISEATMNTVANWMSGTP